MRWCVLLATLALAACGQAPAPPPVKGDEVPPGGVEVTGMAYCDAARLELVAVVLNGPPKGAALEDVADARAPGCTWVASSGSASVRLNVYDEAYLATLEAGGPAAQFEALARARGAGEAVEDVGVRAARFGFTDEAPAVGVLLVETPTRVLEFEGSNVAPAKLKVFARGVTETVEQGES
jgi:hypothetical protein